MCFVGPPGYGKSKLALALACEIHGPECVSRGGFHRLIGGKDLKGHGLTVANAQLAVSGETGKYPEFKGNVKTVDARPFWRDKSVSPSGAGYHYNHNAETYMEVGNALGRAMAELLEKK